MPRPYGGVRNHDYPMHMIGHHDECVDVHVAEMIRHFPPYFFGYFPCLIQLHRIAPNFAKQRRTVVRANRDEICARLPVIKIGQADGTAVVGVWILARSHDVLCQR